MDTIQRSTIAEQRIEEIRRWLASEGTEHCLDQRHLDPGTPERAYWHLGYLAGLTDMASATTGSAKKAG